MYRPEFDGIIGNNNGGMQHRPGRGIEIKSDRGGTSMKYVANLIIRTFRVLTAKFGLWLFRKSADKIVT